MKKQTIRQLHRNGMMALLISVMALVGTGCARGAEAANDTEPAVKQETEKTEPTKLTEKDLKGILDIEDSYAVEKSKGVDLTANLDYDTGIIKEVKADASKVNYDKTGTYQVTYTVSVDAAKLKTTGSGTSANKTVSNNKPTDNADSVSEGSDAKEAEPGKLTESPTTSEIEKVIIEKEVTIVTKEEGEKLADKGETVWTGNKTFLPINEEAKKEKEEAKKDDVKEDVKEDTKTANKDTDKSDQTSSNKNSSEDKQASTNNTSSNTNNSSKPSTSSSSNTGSGSSSGSSANTPSTPTHTHSWVEKTHTVNHEATGHYEDVMVQPGYYETVQVGEARPWNCCKVCGADISGIEGQHSKQHALAGEGSGWYTQYDYSGVSYKDVYIEPVYEKQWVVDRAAWTETVSDGWYCSGCGATK